MKQSPRISTTPVSLPGSIHERLSAYALAVSAAGLGITTVQPAQAKIVYTPVHHVLNNGALPIPIDGTHDFTLSDKFYIITGSWSTQLLNVNVTGIAGVVGSKGSAAALRLGKIIGPTDKFQAGKMLMAGGFCETQISSSKVFGPFANTTQRYLGLKFSLSGRVHYGWARFSSIKASACNGGPAVSATLTGYAYETVPGKSIKAGQTHELDETANNAEQPHLTNLSSPTLTSARLGLLAMGSPGLSIWRREEAALHECGVS